MIISTHIIPCTDAFGSEVDNIIIGIVVISQLLDIVGTLCCCTLFSAERVSHKHEMILRRPSTGIVEDPISGPKYDESLSIRAVEGWENRTRILCKSLQICTCNLFGGSSIEGLESVARHLTAFFHHDGFLDVVPSDVVAGLVLVRLQQRAVPRQVLRGAMSPLHNPANAQTRPCESGQAASVDDVIIEDFHNEAHNCEAKSADSNGTSSSTSDVYVTLKDSTVTTQPGKRTNIFGKKSAGDTKERKASRNVTRTQFNRVIGLRKLVISSPEDKLLVDDLGHYAVYGLASYSLLMLLYMKPCSGPCLACCGGVCGSREPRETRVRDAGTCGLHTSAVTQILRDRRAELVYASLANNVTAKPYFIFIDHEKKNVVLSIRGTLSLEDCITDIVTEPAELDVAGSMYGFEGRGRFAHGGMLQAAMWIRRDLENQPTGVLGELMRTRSVGPQTPLNQRLGLVVVGHSLGAGTAVLLAIMLKRDYPLLRCFAFGCPGSVVDAHTADDCKSFVTSVCLGNDLVCRLSFTSLTAMREQILDAIARAKVNKMVIMQALFKEYVNQVDDLLHAPGTEPDTSFRRFAHAYNEKIRVKVLKLMPTPLHIPGRVIHLAKFEDGVVLIEKKFCCSSQAVYVPVESSRQHLDEIVISPTMLGDHLPDRYTYECERVARNWKIAG